MEKRNEVKKKATDFIVGMLPEDVMKMGPKNYVIKKVIYPAVARTVCDFFAGLSKTMDRALLGSSQNRSGGSAPNDNRSSDYQNFYNRKSGERKANSYDEVVYESYERAEKVLATLKRLISEWDIVSVQKFYYVSGYSSVSWNDNRYGWSNFDDVTIERCRNSDNWRLVLPEPSLIKTI